MKELSQQLSSLCSPFGKILSVTILHGRGQALVEMDSFAAVDNFLTWALSSESTSISSREISDMLESTEYSISMTGGNESDDAEKYRNCGNQFIGDKVEVNSSLPDCNEKENVRLRFYNWSQCAVAERGKQRGNHKIVDNRSENYLGEITNDSDTKKRNTNGNDDANDDNNISKSSAVLKMTTMKTLNHDMILIEVKRSMAVLIRKIITNDSHNRMVARKLRKKNHKKLIDDVGHSRFLDEDKNDVNEDFDENDNKNNDNSNCKIINNHSSDSIDKNNNHNDINNIHDRIMYINNNEINIADTTKIENKNFTKNSVFTTAESKSHFFLSNWKNNKYCLNKKELKLICWPFVVAGGKMEFCPYYKTKIEDLIHENENYLEGEKNELKFEIGNKIKNEIIVDNKTKIENSDNSINFDEKKPNSFNNKTNIEEKCPFVCPLLHINRPILEVPTNLRIFEIEDFFPIARSAICYAVSHL